jgi:hypothetical protein
MEIKLLSEIDLVIAIHSLYRLCLCALRKCKVYCLYAQLQSECPLTSTCFSLFSPKPLRNLDPDFLGANNDPNILCLLNPNNSVCGNCCPRYIVPRPLR